MIKYTYSKENDFPNRLINLSTLQEEIEAVNFSQSLDHINVDGDNCDIWFVESILSAEETTLDNIVASHTGAPEEITPTEVEVANAISLDESRDRSGKIRVHQTSRKVGLTTFWTGAGDDTNDPHNYGDGQRLMLHHKVDQPMSGSFYVDFNCVDNETWVHEVILNWWGCNFDYISAAMVTRATGVTAGSNTNYTLHSSGLIVPAAGNGDISLVSDITQANGGLIFMPEYSDARIFTDDPRPAAFWNAEWDATNKVYKNITPAPYGDGWYNMFPAEVTVKKLVNKLAFIDNGFNILNSSDTDQIGHGMRLKVSYQTYGDDHEWKFNGCLVMHRDKTGQ